MDILKLNFTVFNYCGLWWPDQTTSSKKYFHIILTILTLTILYVFTIMQLLEIILGDYKLNEITDNLFMLLTMLSLCFKVTNFVFRHESITALLNTLETDICRQKNDTELKIQKKFDDIARSNTIFFATIVDVTLVGFFGMPILNESYNKRILPFKVWLPYSLSNISIYWVMYAQQIISMLLAANLNVVVDTLVSGFLVQTCAQLDILRSRIINIVKPFSSMDAFGQLLRNDEIYKHAESTIRKCVQHHVIICKFAATVQNSFGWVMFFQFFASAVTLCSSVFKLSKNNVAAGMEIATLVGYLVCLALQLLFYCWHGNEVKLKSLRISDAVFDIEWHLLKPKMIKSLTTIIARSNKPIEITCGSMFTLSLGTYGRVLKASYSAFNLLQKA